MEGMYLGWGTLALINAALANIDGRSPLLYLLGSMLFGPLVTLVLAVTRYDSEKGAVFSDLIYGQKYNKAVRPGFLPGWLAAFAFAGLILLAAHVIWG